MGVVYWQRVYEPAAPDSGWRILVDRLWPRGITKTKAAVDVWEKDITPSSPLRQAYHKGEIDYTHFAALYAQELAGNPAMPGFIESLKAHLTTGNVTILFAAKEPEKSHIPTLRAYIEAALMKQN